MKKKDILKPNQEAIDSATNRIMKAVKKEPSDEFFEKIEATDTYQTKETSNPDKLSKKEKLIINLLTAGLFTLCILATIAYLCTMLVLGLQGSWVGHAMVAFFLFFLIFVIVSNE
jgi:hypothetical protein